MSTDWQRDLLALADRYSISRVKDVAVSKLRHSSLQVPCLLLLAIQLLLEPQLCLWQSI